MISRLDDIEKELAGAHFERCHQSYLIAIPYITDLKENAVYVDGERVSMSRRYRPLIQSVVYQAELTDDCKTEILVNAGTHRLNNAKGELKQITVSSPLDSSENWHHSLSVDGMNFLSIERVFRRSGTTMHLWESFWDCMPEKSEMPPVQTLHLDRVTITGLLTKDLTRMVCGIYLTSTRRVAAM